MQSWEHEIGDVLLIQHKGEEVVARVADYADSLDNTTPLYCNLRASSNAWWRKSVIKVQPGQIVKALPTWEEDHKAEVMEKHEASIKKTVDAIYARMTPLQRERLAQRAEQRRNRSPLDIMIDRACGLE